MTDMLVHTVRPSGSSCKDCVVCYTEERVQGWKGIFSSTDFRDNPTICHYFGKLGGGMKISKEAYVFMKVSEKGVYFDSCLN